MLKLSNLKYSIYQDLKDPITKEELIKYGANILTNRYHAANVRNVKLLKKSVDARHSLVYILSYSFECDNEDKLLNKEGITLYKPDEPLTITKTSKPINFMIVGMGPAGLFAAKILAEAGNHVTLIEQGASVEERVRIVNEFREKGVLNPLTNIEYGEGGAGTFSDGKLGTNVNSPYTSYVYETFVNFGAHDDILYDAHPHIGTDVLRGVIINFRHYLESLGVKVLFNTRLSSFDSNTITLVQNNETTKLNYDKLILATGHSSRKVYEMLNEQHCLMEPKPFSVGVRVEHKRKDINKAMYHGDYPCMEAANYKQVAHLSNGRSVYTFCMCPGGEVVNASSEEGLLVVNGMSNYLRNGENSNTALLVGIDPKDFYKSSIFDGITFQEELERKAYNACGDNIAPVETYHDFKTKCDNPTYLGKIKPSIKPGYKLYPLNEILPGYVTDSLIEGISLIGKKIHGFDHDDTILTAVETRSSSPIKVIRNDNYESSLKDVYVIGEGSGYSGGITTSAIDGIKVALSILERNR